MQSGSAQPAALRIGDLPLVVALLPDQPFAVSPIEDDSADQVGNGPKPKSRLRRDNPFFCSSSMRYLRFRYFPPCNDSAGKGQRKPSVGWRSPGSRGGLKGPTDRDDPQVPQLIKTGHQIFNPVQSLVNGQVTPQAFNPMALARRRGTGFPPVIVDPIGQTVADGR